MDRTSYFSTRANGMQRSVIRELLKLTQNPEHFPWMNQRIIQRRMKQRPRPFELCIQIQWS